MKNLPVSVPQLYTLDVRGTVFCEFIYDSSFERLIEFTFVNSNGESVKLNHEYSLINWLYKFLTSTKLGVDEFSYTLKMTPQGSWMSQGKYSLSLV